MPGSDEIQKKAHHLLQAAKNLHQKKELLSTTEAWIQKLSLTEPEHVPSKDTQFNLPAPPPPPPPALQLPIPQLITNIEHQCEKITSLLINPSTTTDTALCQAVADLTLHSLQYASTRAQHARREYHRSRTQPRSASSTESKVSEDLEGLRVESVDEAGMLVRKLKQEELGVQGRLDVVGQMCALVIELFLRREQLVREALGK